MPLDVSGTKYTLSTLPLFLLKVYLFIYFFKLARVLSIRNFRVLTWIYLMPLTFSLVNEPLLKYILSEVFLTVF